MILVVPLSDRFCLGRWGFGKIGNWSSWWNIPNQGSTRPMFPTTIVTLCYKLNNLTPPPGGQIQQRVVTGDCRIESPPSLAVRGGPEVDPALPQVADLVHGEDRRHDGAAADGGAGRLGEVVVHLEQGLADLVPQLPLQLWVAIQ